MSYPGHTLGGVLLFCREAVSVFYSPRQLGWLFDGYRITAISWRCCGFYGVELLAPWLLVLNPEFLFLIALLPDQNKKAQSAQLFIHSEERIIHAFPENISKKRNANNFIQYLNTGQSSFPMPSMLPLKQCTIGCIQSFIGRDTWNSTDKLTREN